MLAVSFLLRSQLIAAALSSVVALYCHTLTSLFLIVAIGGYVVTHRRGHNVDPGLQIVAEVELRALH